MKQPTPRNILPMPPPLKKKRVGYIVPSRVNLKRKKPGNIVPTQAVASMGIWLRAVESKRRIIVVEAPHGGGKSCAVSTALKAAQRSRSDLQTVLLDGDCGKDETKFARHIAAAVGVELEGSNPGDVLGIVRSQLCWRRVGTFLIDNIDHLSAECQILVVQLLDVAYYAPGHKIGLLALQSSGGFEETLAEYGYYPKLEKLPLLSYNEVAGFLKKKFPTVERANHDPKQQAKLNELVTNLGAISGGRPRTLDDILNTIAADQGISAEPTVNEIQELLGAR